MQVTSGAEKSCLETVRQLVNVSTSSPSRERCDGEGPLEEGLDGSSARKRRKVEATDDDEILRLVRKYIAWEAASLARLATKPVKELDHRNVSHLRGSRTPEHCRDANELKVRSGDANQNRFLPIMKAIMLCKNQLECILAGVLSCGPLREGSPLVLKDMSTIACEDRKMRKLLTKDIKGQRGLPIVLSERARSTLVHQQGVRSNLPVIVTAFSVKKLWQPKPEAGLVGGAKHIENDGGRYTWAEYPARSMEDACILHGYYLEVTEIIVSGGSPQEWGPSDLQVDGSQNCRFTWRVAAVSPIIQADHVHPPYLLVQAIENEGREEQRQHFLLLKNGMEFLGSVLAPGDKVTIRDHDILERSFVQHIAGGSRAQAYFVVRKWSQISLIPRGADSTQTWCLRPPMPAPNSVQLARECSYVGTVTRRVGAFVLELDGITKIFMTHVPPPRGGRGLRVGSIVRFDNIFRLYFHGKFEGFVLTMRSSTSIIHFAPFPINSHIEQDAISPELSKSADPKGTARRRDMCLRMSPTQQELMPRNLDALTAFWFLESLIQIAHHATPQALQRLSLFEKTKGLLMSIAKSFKPEASNSEDQPFARDVWDEFMLLENPLGMGGQAQIVSGHAVAKPSYLPSLPSIQFLKNQAISFVRKHGLRKLPESTFGLATMQGENYFTSLSGEELALSGQPVAIVGWLGTSVKTGQLSFRDRTGSIEVRPCPSLAKIVAEAKISTPIPLIFSKCRIIIEALHVRAQDNIKMTRHTPRSPLLWEDQYVEGQTHRDTVLRVYLEASSIMRLDMKVRGFDIPQSIPPQVQNETKQDESNSATTKGASYSSIIIVGLLVSLTLPCRRTHDLGLVEVSLKFWSEKLGYMSLVCTSKDGFPQFWNLLCVGQGYRIVNISNQKVAGMARETSSLYNANKETRFEQLDTTVVSAMRDVFWRKHTESGFTFDAPQRIEQVFRRSSSARTLWAMEGIVTSVSLREQRQPQSLPLKSNVEGRVPPLLDRCTGIFIELRDVQSPAVIGVYITDVSRLHMPPGSLRIGSRLRIYNPELISKGQSIYCRVTTASNIIVKDVISVNEDLPAIKPLKDIKIDLLSDILRRGLENGKKIEFVCIMSSVVQVTFALVERRCKVCGWGMNGKLLCPKNCVARSGEDNFELMAKAAMIVDDGSGQGHLFIDGPMALLLLGMHNKRDVARLAELTALSENSKVEFQASSLGEVINQPAVAGAQRPIIGRPVKKSNSKKAELDFIDMVATCQYSMYKRFCIFAKCKHKLSNSKQSMFQEDQAYFSPINVGKNLAIKTASLPKLALIGLHAELIHDSAAMARALLFGPATL